MINLDFVSTFADNRQVFFDLTSDYTGADHIISSPLQIPTPPPHVAVTSSEIVRAEKLARRRLNSCVQTPQ